MSRKTATPLKGDKRYKDAPRYKAVFGYEDTYKDAGRKSLIDMTKEMAKSLSKIAKSK